MHGKERGKDGERRYVEPILKVTVREGKEVWLNTSTQPFNEWLIRTAGKVGIHSEMWD